MSLLHRTGQLGLIAPARARWGFVRTTVSRYGVTYRRLVLLAPGSTERDFRLVRLHQESPWIAVLLSLPALLLAPRVGDLDAVIAAAGVACACVAISAHVSWSARRRAVRLDTCSGPDLAPLPSRATERVLVETSAILRAGQHAVRCARMTPVEFERIWQAAYAAAAPFDSRRRVGAG